MIQQPKRQPPRDPLTGALIDPTLVAAGRVYRVRPSSSLSPLRSNTNLESRLRASPAFNGNTTRGGISGSDTGLGPLLTHLGVQKLPSLAAVDETEDETVDEDGVVVESES